MQAVTFGFNKFFFVIFWQKMSEQASQPSEQEEVKAVEPKKRKPRAPKDPNAPPRKRAPKDPNAPPRKRAPKDPNAPKEPRKRKQPVVMDQTQEEPGETTSVATKRKRTTREEKIATFRAKLCNRSSRYIMVIVGPSRIDSTRRRFGYWETINILTKNTDRWTDLPSNVTLNSDTPCELTIFDDESSTQTDILQAITTHAIVLRETSIEVPLFVVAEKTIVAE